MRTLLVIFLIGLGCDVCLAQVTRAGQMPKIRTIGEGVVWRLSDNKDPSGEAIPPWKEVQVTNLFGFKLAPRLGEKVTVIPLDVNSPLLELTIIKIQKRTACYEPGGDPWWEVELEPVKQKEYFEITKPGRREEVPFDVVIIYPAVKFAHQLGRNELKKTMLPTGVALDTVKAAIDLTNDGIPDVLMTEYCCLHPAKSAGECDLTCGKTFQKVGKRWKLVDTSNPC